MQSPIKFGTDGWRGLIAEDFTFANVRIAAAAIANYVHQHEDGARGLCIGYDTRFLSRDFALAVARVLAASGLPIRFADRYTPTPALSFAVRQYGAAGGVMITSSHNPAQWNGLKYKASYGGPSTAAITNSIESSLGQSLPCSPAPAPIEEADFHTAYIAAIARFVDLDLIRRSGMRFAVDCMYGAGRGVLAGLFAQAGIPHIEIRAEINPLFPGINPEPIEPHIAALQQTVVEHHCHAGLVTDGDADRIGAVDEHGNFVDPNKIFCILLRWMLERRNWPGDITRAVNTTSMIDRIAARHGRPLIEHGIGFKYVCELMLQREILIGGEEAGGIGFSRHMPERDGLLCALLLAQIMAEESQTLGQLVESLQQQYGEHYYGRIDLHLDNTLKNAAMTRARSGLTTFAGMPILRTVTIDGIKFFLQNPEAASLPNTAETWITLRASGTEPLLRIYAESCSRASLAAVLNAGREFATTTVTNTNDGDRL
jgi:phosphomannomutase